MVFQSQLARLCEKIAVPTLDLLEETCDDTDDSGSESSITGEDALSDEADQQPRVKPFECPDKTCDHKAFVRNQDLVRHFTKRTT
jgi:hypothetical protein